MPVASAAVAHGNKPCLLGENHRPGRNLLGGQQGDRQIGGEPYS
jgi:hypothetical protein